MEFFFAFIALMVSLVAWRRASKAFAKADLFEKRSMLLEAELAKLRSLVAEKKSDESSLTTSSPSEASAPQVPLASEQGESQDAYTQRLQEMRQKEALRIQKQELRKAEEAKLQAEQAALASEQVETLKSQDLAAQREMLEREAARKQAVADAFRLAKAAEREKRNAKWRDLERKISENWTGILGSVAMVLGVGFLGIYAALKLTAFFRFLLITAFAGGLYGMFLNFKSKPQWRQFADWLGSSGVAVFLFGCFGSGGVAGLQWIDNQYAALALLSLGIAVNFYFAAVAGTPTFASLHTVLCLTSLIVVPSDTTLVVAALVTLGSISFSYRYKWDLHLLIALSAFFIFYLVWRVHFDNDLVQNMVAQTDNGALQLTMLQRGLGVGCLLAVGLVAGFIHYRKDYVSTRVEPLPFAAHIVNWFYTGIGLALLSTGSPWVSFPLAAATVAAFVLARRARTLGVAWVYRTDTLLSQVLALLTLYSLNRWGVDAFSITGLMFVQVLVFGLLMLREEDRVMSGIAIRLAHAGGLIFLFVGLSWQLISTDTLTERSTATLVLTTVAALGFQYYTLKNYGEKVESLALYLPWMKDEQNAASIVGMLAGFFLVPLYITLYHVAGAGYIMVGSLVTLGLIQIWLNSNGLGIGLVAAAAVIHVMMFAKLTALSSADAWQGLVQMALLFVVMMLFLLNRTRSKNPFLTDTGKVAVLLSCIAFVVAVLVQLDFSNQLSRYAASGITLAVCAAGLAFHAYLLRAFSDGYDSLIYFGNEAKPQASAFGVLMGILPLVAFIGVWQKSWAETAMLAVLGGLMLSRTRWLKSNGLGIGLLVSLIAVHLFTWSYLKQDPNPANWKAAAKATPLFALSLVSIWTATFKGFKTQPKFFGIYLFAIHAVVASYLIFNSLSPLIAGVLWLVLSVIALELALAFGGKDTRENGEAGRHLLYVGYFLLTGFLIRHFAVHLQVESYIGVFKTRLVIELFALSVFAYWLSAKRPAMMPEYRTWTYLHPLVLETLLLFGVTTAALEVPNLWHPFVWIVAAISIFFYAKDATGVVARLRLYSLFLAWASAVQVAIVTASVETPSLVWYDQPWFAGTVALLLQVAYLVLINRENMLVGIAFPRAVTRLSTLPQLINLKKNLWIYYPFFITTAVFLYWRFDLAILTLLWVVECVIVFALGIALRVGQFRTVALAALGVCVVRLVFFDLFNSDTITRGVVFLGVGGLMLAMNFLYKKFQSVFEK